MLVLIKFKYITQH